MDDLEAFRCPNCREKGFEITSEAEDISAIDGAVCVHCGHVLTREEFLDWLAKAASQSKG
jgi:DNA-directed RNA polymerase subunit RPC12/RpoP